MSKLEHPRPLVRHVLRQPERLQLPHRLPDRRDAHAERTGEARRAEAAFRGQLAQDDRLAQLLEGVLGHRPVPHAGRSGCRCAASGGPSQTLDQMSNAMRGSTRVPPRLSVSQITTLRVELRRRRPRLRGRRPRRHRDLGAEARRRAPTWRRSSCWQASGLEAASAVPAVPSFLPLPLLGGPEDPAERLESMCSSLERLAPFGPRAIVCLTGTGAGREQDEARSLVIDGLRRLHGRPSCTASSWPSSRISATDGEPWSLVTSIPEAVELIHDAGDPPALGLQFDIWHLWNTETLYDDIAREAHRLRGCARGRSRGSRRAAGPTGRCRVTVTQASRQSCVRSTTRAGTASTTSRSSPTTARSRATYPDSFWAAPPEETLARAVAAFERCWTPTHP